MNVVQYRPLPKIEDIVRFLDATIVGQSAEALLASGKLGKRTNGALVVLPAWVWLTPKIDVGRKGKTSDGDDRAMPVRLVWSRGNVLVFDGPGEQRMTAHLVGMGWDQDVNMRVRILGDMTASITPVQGEELSPEVRRFATRSMLERSVHGLIKTGNAGRWDLITSLEGFVRRALVTANRTVATELGEHTGHAVPNVVDEIGLDDLLAQLLYGESRGSSVISRMVDRAVQPDTFKRVDPMRYLSVSIRARSEEAIRGAIGDPKVGPKVRRIARMSGAQTIDDLLDAYRAAYPRDSLAARRAIAALTAGPMLAAYQREFVDARRAAVEVAL